MVDDAGSARSRPAVLAAAALALSLIGAASDPPEAAAPAPAVPSPVGPPPTASPEPRPAPRTFANPVVAFDCPDPGVLVEGDPATYYMTCTGGTLPIRTSTDLVHWKESGAALLPGGLAPWAGDGEHNWAPEIHRVKFGYVAYYTAADATGRLCIGAAHASAPLGPWIHEQKPLVRDAELGAIDAHFFADTDGTPYLYWKLDGNAVGKPTPIMAQRLEPDGMEFAAGTTAREVLRNDPTTWEGPVVEAPWVTKHDGTYLLFYSGNSYDEHYATGVARSASPLGPFEKRGAPLVASDGAWLGPGHGAVVAAGSIDVFVHHAWRRTADGARDAGGGRMVVVDRLAYDGGWPRIVTDPSAPPPASLAPAPISAPPAAPPPAHAAPPAAPPPAAPAHAPPPAAPAHAAPPAVVPASAAPPAAAPN